MDNHRNCLVSKQFASIFLMVNLNMSKDSNLVFSCLPLLSIRVDSVLYDQILSFWSSPFIRRVFSPDEANRKTDQSHDCIHGASLDSYLPLKKIRKVSKNVTLFHNGFTT